MAYPSLSSALVCFLLALVGGCAISPAAPISGNSSASARLLADTSNMVVFYVKTQTKCQTVEAIRVEPIRNDQNLKRDDQGVVTQGNIDERWIAKACGQDIPFLITFIPDGKGGSYYRVRREGK